MSCFKIEENLRRHGKCSKNDVQKRLGQVAKKITFSENYWEDSSNRVKKPSKNEENPEKFIHDFYF